MRSATAFAAAVLALGAAVPAGAGTKVFSYDPANGHARVLSERGFSFEFKDGLFGGQRVTRLMSSHADAEADLIPSSESAMGAPLNTLIGARVDERDVYEIDPKGVGAALIRAACPGADRGWLAFGELGRHRLLKIHAIGRDAASKAVRFCATLVFEWRGEWKLPDDRALTSDPRTYIWNTPQ